MATIGQAVGRGDWHFVRGTDVDLAVLWEADPRDGSGWRPVDLTGWEGTLRLYDLSGATLLELACEMDAYGHQTAHVPASALAGAEWDGVTGGTWRMTATDGTVTVPMGEGYFSLGWEGGPHQMVDRRTVGIPDDVAAVRQDVRDMRDSVADALGATLLVESRAEAEMLAIERRATDTCAAYEATARGHATSARESAEEAAGSAERAEVAASASRAVIVAADEPPRGELWDGRAWFKVEADGAVRTVRVWDSDADAGVLRCGACVCGPDTRLVTFGRWDAYPLAAGA